MNTAVAEKHQIGRESLDIEEFTHQLEEAPASRKKLAALLKEIIERLKPLHPEKVILFGSYAYGEPHKDSDIDLLVVTGDEFIPRNYREKSEIYLKVAYLMWDIEKRMPIDLIVHTKKMHEKFIELNSMFCRKIQRVGERTYVL